MDARLRERFDCSVILRDGPEMRSRADHLKSLGVGVEWYPLVQSYLVRRMGRLLGNRIEQHFWFGVTRRMHPSLVWFNLASLGDAAVLEAAADVYRLMEIPYWLVIQHALEHFFRQNDEEMRRFARIVEGAKRVVCIAERNRMTLERAIGRRLGNIWITVNAISHEFLTRAVKVSETHSVRVQGTVRFLNLARFDPICKGQHILLEALSDSRWQERDWCLTLQGSGHLATLLERLVEFYGLNPNRVHIHDHAKDVLPVIAEFDLLVMPSLSEGTPFALVEAMACARPAVGTPVGGVPELILDGETGWLARSTEVADVADALERAWTVRHQWPIIGAKAQARVAATYDQSRTVLDIIEALQEDTGLTQPVPRSC